MCPGGRPVSGKFGWGTRAVIAVVLSLCVQWQLLLCAAWAQDAAPINLDLTSTHRALPAGSLAGSGAAINVGGVQRMVTPESMLTPAERLALYQMSSTGSQSIVLGANGNATSGAFNIGPRFAQYVNSLVIPSGVTAIKDFAQAQALNLGGNLVNSGVLQALSSNSAITSGVISAANIFNTRGAVISSTVDLTLNAANSFINLGSINSSGQLSIQAPKVLNSGLIASSKSMQISTDLLVNSGVIQSATSAVISSLSGPSLFVSNAGGQIRAGTELQFLTTCNAAIASSLRLSGGDLVAKTIRMDSPGGDISVNANSIGGDVRLSGANAEVHVQSGALNIASLVMSNDPILTSPDAISLSVNGDTTYTDLILLSGGDVTITGPNGATLSTEVNGTASNVLIGAGVTYDGQTITGASPSGGSIKMAGINVSAPGAQVSLTAKAGGSSAGNIEIGGVDVSGLNGSTGGSGSNGTVGRNGGTVTISAAGSLTFGSIKANGGNGGAGADGVGGAVGFDGSDGGNHEDGGHGAAGQSGGIGLAGGSGGVGGAAGIINVTAGSLSGVFYAVGGNGGSGGFGGHGGAGGKGGDGGDSNGVFGDGGNGGAGGAGGAGAGGGSGAPGGRGGTLTISAASAPGVTFFLNGGSGGNGGVGGDGGAGGHGGGSGDSSGGTGGNGGAGGVGGVAGGGGAAGDGGQGGTLEITLSGSLTSGVAANGASATSVLLSGGAGGVGANGGVGGSGGSAGGAGGGIGGGSGASGGNGGAGGGAGQAGNGGNGGSLTVTADIAAFYNQINANGGAGGAGGNGGSGNNGGSASGGGGGIGGGAGGHGADGGAAAVGGGGGGGGSGGTVTINTTNALSALGDITANGGNGADGGDGGDGGDGTSGHAAGGGIASADSGKGGSGTAAGAAGGGGSGGNGGTIYLASSTADVTVTNLSTTGGAGGDGGDGGDGGSGGNGGTSPVEFHGVYQGGDPQQTSTEQGTIGFDIGTTGSSGGSGANAGGGGAGGFGGNGGDITIFAPLGAVTVSGCLNAYGNNSGLAGSTGVSGSNGKNGASNSYFGLAVDVGFQPSAAIPGYGNLALGGQITIDNTTVGAVGYFSTSDTPSAISVYVNQTSADGTVEDYYINIGETGVSLNLPINGSTVYYSDNFVADVIGGDSLNEYVHTINANPAPFVYTNSITVTPYTANSTYTQISSNGTTVTTTSGLGATAAAKGGNISVIAGTTMNVGGTINALGGETVVITSQISGNTITYTGTTYLGVGGSLSLQAPTITITGGPTGPSATAPTVAAGSVAFLTKFQGIDVLVKPIEYAALTWETNAGLNVGNGAGVILATSPVTLIQNAAGTVDLNSIASVDLFATSTTYTPPHDLVVLATGNIIASNVMSSASITTGANGMGQIILASGNLAATETYGVASGNSPFVVLQTNSTTGGAINLPNVSIGSSNTTLVFLQANSGTATGFVSTGTVTASTGANNSVAGAIHIVSSGDVLTANANANMLFVMSTNGSVGTADVPLTTAASYLGAYGYEQVQIKATAPQVNLLSSSASTLDINASTGKLFVRQPVSGYTTILTAQTTMSILATVTGLGASGIVNIHTVNDIDDSIGIAKISSPNIFINSSGSVHLANPLSTTGSIILQGSGTAGGVKAVNLSAPFVAAIAGSGGITVNTTNATDLVLNSTGDVTVHDTAAAVELGGNAGLFSVGKNFNLSVDGNLTVTGVVEGLQTLNLSTSTGSNGSIILSANIIGDDSVTLSADGSGSISMTKGYIQTPSLTLVSKTGDIGAYTASLFSNASVINFETTGSVYLFNTNANGLTIENQWSGTNFYLVQNGPAVINGELDANGTVAIAAVVGALTTNAEITGTQVILTTADTTGSGQNQDLTINAELFGLNNVTLASSNASSVIVASGVQVAGGFVSVQTSNFVVNGQVIAESGDLTVADSTPGTIVVDAIQGSLSADGSIIVNGGTNNVNFSVNSLVSPLQVTGDAVSITAFEGSLTNVTVSANTLQFSAPGDVFIDSTSSIEVLNSIAGGGNHTVQISTEANGSITITGTLSYVGSNSIANLLLDADGSGSIFSTNTLVADHISLSSETGSIGIDGEPLNMQTSTVDVTAGEAYLANDGAVTITDSFALNTLSLSAQGALTATGTLVGANVDLHSTTSILIAENTSISAVGTTGGTGQVRIYTSSQPAFGPGQVPNDVAVTNTDGEIFFNNGITATGATNNVIVSTGQVLFDTGTLPASAIVLGGNVTINGTATQDSFFRITSLDLTSPLAVQDIVALQRLGLVGGKLIVSGGVAVGGNAILNPIVLGDLSALNIPENVTLSYIGFSRLTPVRVHIDDNSTTKQVKIDGTQQFRGIILHPVMRVSSTLEGPAISIGEDGIFTAGGSISLFSERTIEVNGTLSSRLSLKLAAPEFQQNLRVALGDGARIRSELGSLLFNPGLFGGVEVVGDGTLKAGLFGRVEFLNLGGPLTVLVDRIDGKVVVTGSSVRIVTQNGNLQVGNVFPLSPLALDGPIAGSVILRAESGNLIAKNVTTVGLFSGGAISLFGSESVVARIVSASALLGSGGVIRLESPVAVSARLISASSVGGRAGEITVKTGSLDVTGKDLLGNSISAASVLGSAGRINLELSNPFSIGNVSSEGTLGNVNANGAVNGGQIKITAPVIGVNRKLTANGGSGDGGMILLQNPGLKEFTVQVNGLLQAKNNGDSTGRVGINTGACCTKASLIGSGTVHGGEFVSFGNIDPDTFELLRTPGGNLEVSRSLTIGNDFKSNPGSCEPPPPTPPTPPGPSNNALISTLVLLPSSSSGLGGRVPTDTTSVGVSTDQANHPNPVSFPGQGSNDDNDPPLSEQVLDGIGSFSADTISALQNAGLKVALGDVANVLRLLQGQLLLTPSSPLGIQTNEGMVNIGAGATALVMETGNDVSVYNLNDRKAGDVSVVVGDQRLSLAPGQQLVLTRVHDATFDKVNPGRHIAFRNPKKVRVTSDVTAFYSEFSIASAINGDRGIRRMMNSSNSRDRSTASRMMKMAAIRQVIGSNPEPYRKSAPVND